jgi:hypothetical protein
MPCNLLPAQLGFYLNALASRRFVKTEVAFGGVKSDCDPGELRTQIMSLLLSQPSLRLGITWIGTEPYVTERGTFRLDLLDARKLPGSRIPDVIESSLRQLEDEVSTSDSSAGLLAALPRDRYELYLFIDHMYFDGVSMGTLESEMKALWRGGTGHGSSWPTMAESVNDELARAERIQHTQGPSANRVSWQPMAGRHAGASSQATVTVRASGPGWERTMASAKATDYQMGLASYGLALAAAFRCRDFVVGVPTVGIRIHEPRLELAIGCYTNTVYVRIDTDGCSSFGDVLAATRSALIEAMDADIPATMEMGWEYASAAARREWLIRRLNYPVVIQMLRGSGAPEELKLINFPYRVGGEPRRLMSMVLERPGGGNLRLYSASDSSDPGLAGSVTRAMASVLKDVADSGPEAASGILAEVASYAPAIGRRPRASARHCQDLGELATWLDVTLRGDPAVEVVTDEFAYVDTAAGEHVPATDVLSVIKAYVLHPELTRGLPVELVRRDASPAGLALSRRVFEAR